MPYVPDHPFSYPSRSLPRFFLSFLVVSFLFPVLSAAQPDLFVSFGGKIGYAFGPSGGTIGGIEVSVTRWPDDGTTATGFCVSWEKGSSFTLIHAGLEMMHGVAGVSLGPSMVFRNDTRETGLTGTLWGGFLLLPYLRTTWLPASERSIPEYGTFVKFPHRLTDGKTFRLGG